MRRNKKYTIQEFIDKSNKIQSEQYDYTKVKYINNKTKVCIICSKHGEFWQRPCDHLNGHGCHKCANEQIQIKRRLTTNEFIQKAVNIHKNKYNYSKVDYKGSHNKVEIICLKHGGFWQQPNCHLSGQGCPKCKAVNIGNLKRKTQNEFIQKATKIHNGKYVYKNVNYINNRSKNSIICPIHGEFWQNADKHLKGQGCPKCAQSHIETEVMICFEKYNIKVNPQYKYDEQHKLSSLDFYLPDYKIAIECQGEQHFKPVDFGNKGKDFAVRQFNENLLRDKTKFDRCKELNIKLYYYIPNNSDRYVDNEKYNFIYNEDNVIEDIESFITVLLDEYNSLYN